MKKTLATKVISETSDDQSSRPVRPILIERSRRKVMVAQDGKRARAS